jgi:hypothetical protein
MPPSLAGPPLMMSQLAGGPVHPRIQLVRVRRVDREHARPGFTVHEQRARPRSSTVGGLVDAALGAVGVERALRRDPETRESAGETMILEMR